MEIRLGYLRSGLVGYMRIILEVAAYTAGQLLILFFMFNTFVLINSGCSAVVASRRHEMTGCVALCSFCKKPDDLDHHG